jgi:HAD superfamily hydrolase (TIGR01509 family)
MPPLRATKWMSAIAANALITAKPAPTHAVIANSETSALYGSSARKARKEIAWKGKQREKDHPPGRKIKTPSSMSDYDTAKHARIKGVLFDFDGTLTMPGALDFPAIKREMACPPDLPILEYLETLPPLRKGPLLEILETKEGQAARESLPNKGAEACLDALKRKGLLIGIITRNSLQSVQKAFEKFKTIDYRAFAAIITRDDGPPKPHPDGVYRAAQRMGIFPHELLVVGDFRFDIIAGYGAGSPTVLLTNGREPVITPEDPAPDYMVVCLEELPAIVDRINLL